MKINCNWEHKWNHQWVGISLGQKDGSTESIKVFADATKDYKGFATWKSMKNKE